MVKRIALIAAGLREHGFESRVMARHASGAIRSLAQANALQIETFGIHTSAKPFLAWRLFRSTQSSKAEVVHVWLSTGDTNWCWALAAASRPKRLVVSMLD